MLDFLTELIREKDYVKLFLISVVVILVIYSIWLMIFAPRSEIITESGSFDGIFSNYKSDFDQRFVNHAPQNNGTCNALICYNKSTLYFIKGNLEYGDPLIKHKITNGRLLIGYFEIQEVEASLDRDAELKIKGRFVARIENLPPSLIEELGKENRWIILLMCFGMVVLFVQLKRKKEKRRVSTYFAERIANSWLSDHHMKPLGNWEIVADFPENPKYWKCSINARHNIENGKEYPVQIIVRKDGSTQSQVEHTHAMKAQEHSRYAQIRQHQLEDRHDRERIRLENEARKLENIKKYKEALGDPQRYIDSPPPKRKKKSAKRGSDDYDPQMYESFMD